MEKKNHSVKFLRQRRFLMILPTLTLPFVTLIFWALGGGKTNDTMAQSNIRTGLNLKLPDAQLKDEKELTKLSFYQQAALDSAKTKAAEKLDPYWNRVLDDSAKLSSGYTDYGVDANKMKVYKKLDELKMVLSKSQEASDYNHQSVNRVYSVQSNSSSNEIERLQSMMQKMKNDRTEDPEITQLNEMLDKIMAIQNPDQPKSSENKATAKNLQVKTKNKNAAISLLTSDTTALNKNDTTVETNSSNAFYGITNNVNTNESSNVNSIAAIIPETQTLVAGSTVKLVLTSDVTINDILLPSGTLIYGTASVTNERLKISISTIRFQNVILSVTLNVYDMDGQEGIYIPGSINRTVAKESANNAIGGMSATTIDPSLGAQAASAGIEAAKSLFSKKIKLVKMTVRSGYKVLLKDNHDN